MATGQPGLDKHFYLSIYLSMGGTFQWWVNSRGGSFLAYTQHVTRTQCWNSGPFIRLTQDVIRMAVTENFLPNPPCSWLLLLYIAILGVLHINEHSFQTLSEHHRVIPGQVFCVILYQCYLFLVSDWSHAKLVQSLFDMQKLWNTTSGPLQELVTSWLYAVIKVVKYSMMINHWKTECKGSQYSVTRQLVTIHTTHYMHHDSLHLSGKICCYP